VRLISSFVMLAVVAGGVTFYSIRKSNELFDVGLSGHVHCSVAGTWPHQAQKAGMEAALGSQFGPMLDPVLNATGEKMALAAYQCTVEGRSYFDIVLQRSQALVSVLLTQRKDQEVFPRALAGAVTQISGIGLHESERQGYSVAAFESGAWLGYVVSALTPPQNHVLAARLIQVVDRYTKP
jgi:hypothetical protein